MKTIWYAAVKTLEVPDNATDDEIDELVQLQVHKDGLGDADFTWSDDGSPLDIKYCF